MRCDIGIDELPLQSKGIAIHISDTDSATQSEFSHLSEPNQVHNVQCTARFCLARVLQYVRSVTLPYVIRPSFQEIFPITCLPESEALHVVIVVSHGSISVRSSL